MHCPTCGIYLHESNSCEKCEKPKPEATAQSSLSANKKQDNPFWYDVSDLKGADKAINGGIWASIFIGVVNAIAATYSLITGNLAYGFIDAWSYVDSILAFTIAYWIYKRGRYSALAGVIWFLIEKAYQLELAPETLGKSGTAVAVIVLWAYMMAVRGISSAHKHGYVKRKSDVKITNVPYISRGISVTILVVASFSLIFLLIASSNERYEEAAGWGFFGIFLSLCLSVPAFIKLLKHKITARTLSLIGICWSLICLVVYMAIFRSGYDGAAGWGMFSLLYTIPYAIYIVAKCGSSSKLAQLNKDEINAIKDLHELYKIGALTEEEFQKKKKEIL